VFQDALALEVLALVNAERAAAGLHALRWDANFASTARIRAEEISRNFAASHARPDGRSWTTAISDAGISYSLIGENMARGGHSTQGAQWYVPSKVMASWMSSHSHRANILNSGFEVMGVGAFDLNGTRYYVQHFGALR